MPTICVQHNMYTHTHTYTNAYTHTCITHPGTVEYNALIASCMNDDPPLYAKAYDVYKGMKKAGINGDVRTYNMIMRSLTSIKRWKDAMAVMGALSFC